MNLLPKTAAFRFDSMIKSLYLTIFLVLFSSFYCVFCNDSNNSMTSNDDQKLLDRYIQSMGNNIISFDSSNIKRFWIENTVVCDNDQIIILLKQDKMQLFESNPYNIQLVNVNETMDCNITIISKDSDFSFTVMNPKSKVISSSTKDSFIKYNVISSVFHLEDTTNSSFSLKFSSSSETIKIDKIILSFSSNAGTSFYSSPGRFIMRDSDMSCTSTKSVYQSDGSVFSFSGPRNTIISNKKILLSNNNTISCSLKLKNAGKVPAMVYYGYIPYTKKGEQISKVNTAYKSTNKTLTVKSSKASSNIIVVDSYPEWEKGCYLALNAKDNYSDFPNSNFAGIIDDVKKIDDFTTEIYLSRPLTSAIKDGTKIRVQSKPGATYLYLNAKRLEPEEEITYTSSIAKDDMYLDYSPISFSRGTYYVVPIILANSIDSPEDNIIIISDFTISF